MEPEAISHGEIIRVVPRIYDSSLGPDGLRDFFVPAGPAIHSIKGATIMKQIRISDVTMKQHGPEISLSFREKIEMSKLLDKLGVDLIELEPISQPKIDSLRIKSVAAAVKHSAVAVPVALNSDSVRLTWNALKDAKHPRLQVCAPVSPVQMEYLFHKKPDAMLSSIREAVTECRKVCADVEFVADDATRADTAYLVEMLNTAISAGATTVTLCDTAGTMLPSEFATFIQTLYQAAPDLKTVCVGVACVNTLSMADACVIAAAGEGVNELKVAGYPLNNASLANVARVLAAKGDALAAVYAEIADEAVALTKEKGDKKVLLKVSEKFEG